MLISETDSSGLSGPGKRSKVKFDFCSLRRYVVPLLVRLGAGDNPTQAGRCIGLSKQHAHYYVVKLWNAGLLQRDKRSSVVFYQLTESGKNFLKRCEGDLYPGGFWRLDKVQVAFPILKGGVIPESAKKIEMQNWSALLLVEDGIRVRVTTQNVIVHVPVVRAQNPFEAQQLASNMANRVSASIVSKYGFVLGEGHVQKGCELAFGDPVAKMFGRYFTVSTPERHIDHSWGPGELEHLNMNAVVNYLEMPEEIKALRLEVAELTKATVVQTEAIRNMAVQNGEKDKQFSEYVQQTNKLIEHIAQVMNDVRVPRHPAPRDPSVV